MPNSPQDPTPLPARQRLFQKTLLRVLGLGLVALLLLAGATLFQTSSATLSEQLAIFIDSLGKVGIGTKSPTTELEVAGTVKATAFQGDGSGLTGLPTASAKNQVNLIAGAALAGATTPVPVYVHPGGLILEQATSESGAKIYGIYRKAQTFQTDRGTTAIQKIALKLQKVGSPKGQLAVQIWTVDEKQQPTGSPLATTTNILAKNITDGWNEFAFTGLTVEPTTTYAIVVSVPNGYDSDYIKWQQASSDVYAGGSTHTCANYFNSWVAEPEKDFAFRLYSHGRVYPCAADRVEALTCLGFATTKAQPGESVTVQTSGIVGGFTDLVVGAKYYVQDVAGTIGEAPGSHQKLVGMSVSEQELSVVWEEVEDLANALEAADGSPKQAVYVDEEGKVGVGVTKPAAKLEVAGDLKLGDTASTCTGALTGTLKYVNNLFYACDGSAWRRIPLAMPGAHLMLSPATQTGMDLNGGVSPGNYVTFTLKNVGSKVSDTITTAVSNATNFEIGTDQCAGQTLGIEATCTLQVRPKATKDGALSGQLQISAQNNPSANLSGTARGFRGYDFTTHTFTNCGQTGRSGPSPSQCRSAYTTAWDGNNSYFTVNNGIQEWTVPATGTYRIEAWGAKGAGTNAGKGIKIKGDFNLSQDAKIKILVGQQGLEISSRHGGGGGSFVILGSTPLIVAGGGGGGGLTGQGHIGGNGEFGMSGGAGSKGSGGTSGKGGSHGGGGVYSSGGGGGMFSNGESDSNLGSGQFGYGFLQGGQGGIGSNQFNPKPDGGFGGGGGSDTGGGGGGGYSGGGSSANESKNGYGGGGGSYCGDQAGGDCKVSANSINGSSWEYNAGHGKVIITKQ